MKMFKSTLLTVFILAMCNNCTPIANLNYMQDSEEVAKNISINDQMFFIQAGDQLGITVTAENMEAVSLFNPSINNIQVPNLSQPSSNFNQRVTLDYIPVYTVSSKNTIIFPVLGEISTKDKTIEMLRSELQLLTEKYIYEPLVNIKNINYKITVLGEVNRPGTYTIPDGHVTFLSGLGLAGDLTKYGIRNNILIVRNENGIISKKRIDITKSEFINSPFYHLKQNDVIYVDSNDTVAKQSKLNPNTTIYISVAAILVTVLALIFKK